MKKISDVRPRCPICDSTKSKEFAKAQDVEYHTMPNVFTFLVCDCGVVYLENPPIDKLKLIYPANYYSYVRRNGFVAKVKRSLDKRTFQNSSRFQMSDSLSLLDIGGGDGVEASTAIEADSRITHAVIVDLDESARERAELNGHSFVCSRIENFETEELFDLILALNLIEHVMSPREVLMKAYDLLNFGGSLLLKTPNIDSLDCRIFKNNNWGGLHTPRHWVLFTKDTLTLLLKECGFQSVEVRYTQGGPFWTIGIISYIKKLNSKLIKNDQVITETAVFKTLMPILALADLVRSKLGFKTSQMFVIARKI